MVRKVKKCKTTQKPHWLRVLKTQEHPKIKELVDLEDNECELPEWSNDETQNQFWSEVDANFKFHLNNIFPPENAAGGDEPNDGTENGGDSASREKLEADAQQFISATADAIREEVLRYEEPVVSNHMIHLVTVMQGLLGNNVIKQQVRIHITDLMNVWCQKKLIMNESVSLCALLFLLKKSVEPTALKADVHRVFQFREALRFSFSSGEPNPVIMKLLLELPRKPIYLECKEGRAFIALSMSLDPGITEDIHEVIKKALETCKTTDAQSYGAIYCQAWQTSPQPVKEVIERKFKNYMHHFFMFQRKGLALSELGANVFQIAKTFHAQRTNLAVKKMLSGIYSTLLWMFLEDGSNNNRCNAAQVLFDAYPMDKPGAGREENTLFLGEQHRVMTNLLTDRCHLIRIIAVRQICGIMAEYWVVIPRDILKDWIKIIVEQLANDAADIEVRRSVYRSIPKLFANVNAEEYLKDVLPRLGNNFHDVNQNVRLAFAEMLIAMKKSTTMKFWDVVPIEHIVVRLELESQFVGSKLVDLIFDSFLAPHFPPDSILRRLSQLIVMNRNSARKFFLFSECRLNASRAIELMLMILAKMYTHVKTMLQQKRRSSSNTALSILQENNPKQKNKKSKKKKKKLFCGKENVSLDTTSDREDTEDETVTEEEKNKDIYLQLDPSNPHVSQGFIDIVCTLWTVHSHTYLKPEHAAHLKNLHDLCASCVPLFLRYFKDNAIFGSVLYLCSLVPLQVLKPVSTIEGMLLSQIKKMTLSDKQDNITMRVHPLCMWGRGTDILEIAQDWMNEAFRIENLNSSVMEGGNRRRRIVNFEKTHEAKPRMGLRLLAAVLDQPVTKTKVIERNYEQLMEFWLFMSKIKALVDSRMMSGEPFDHPLLSDEFLQECFKQYILLIPTLDVKDCTSENKINSREEFKFIFRWSTECLIRAVPEEIPSDPHRSSNVGANPFSRQPLPIIMVKDILEVAANMVAIGHIDEIFSCEAGRFCLAMLRTGCKMMFVRSVTRYLSVFMVYLKHYHKQDKLNLFRSVTITIVMEILNTFAEVRYDLNTVQRLLENVTEVKGFLSSVLSAWKLYGKSSSKFVHRLARSFVVNIIKIMKHEISVLQLVDSVKKVQDLPCLACMLVLLVQSSDQFDYVFLEELKIYFDSEDFLKDPLLLVSGFSLLHLLAHSPGKFKKPDLTPVLEAAQAAFSKYEEHVKEHNITTEFIDTANTSAKLNVMAELKALKKATRTQLLGNDALELWEVDELVRQQLQCEEEEEEEEEAVVEEEEEAV
ncbi:condensin-2 complex subunit G2 [Anabrus simplex]|uniref:condensin-2 complex subunit G2 n=1 Tax=Anabrus simplex TaxID=316456 RepID=UPI0035A33761